MMVRSTTSFAFATVLLLAACNMGSTPDDVLSLKSDLTVQPRSQQASYKRLAIGLKAQKKQLIEQRYIARRQDYASKVSFALLRTNSSLSSVQIVKEQLVAPEIMAAQALLKRGDAPSSATNPLARFQGKLADLKSRKRSKPVTILHIGGGHIAADHFSQHIRTALQAKYGDAGRGMVLPAAAFRGSAASGIEYKINSGWRSETALKRGGKKRFGISGVRVSADSPESFMTVKSKTGRFDWAEVTVATGPHQGAFLMFVGKERRRFNAFSKQRGSKTFRMNVRGKKVTVRPGGIGALTVLNVSTGKNRRGVRYINFGLNGASAYTSQRFDMRIVRRDIQRIKPDLIVFGYGTNEGFQDKLNLDSYSKYVAGYMKRLNSYAPKADLVYLGAPSALRKKGGKQCGSWSIPPKFAPLRATVREIAEHQRAGYWGWSSAMGGPCGAETWAKKGLATKDRIRLTSEGYKRSATAFVKWLTTPPAEAVLVSAIASTPSQR